MKRVLAFIAVAAAIGAGGITAHASSMLPAGTLFVSTTGSDTNDCSQPTPCATLQHAVDQALPGGTVKVLPGTYNQTVNITKPVSLIGSGESSTIIDGSNIDTGAGLGTQDPTAPSATPYFGVVSVQNNPGPGGAIKIRGIGIDHAFVTATESSFSEDPTDLSIYSDANTGDTIAITEVTLGAVQDPADYGGIGLDVFNGGTQTDGASVSFFDGVSAGNFQGAQLEGGGIGGHVSVTKSLFTHLIACTNLCSGSPTTTYPAEGLSIISDQPGTAVDTINSNTFQNYSGYGIAVDAGYAAGNCTSTVCTGNVQLTGNFNGFRMGACALASDDCSAIFLDAQGGNKLSAHLQGNHGTIRKPATAIFEQPPTGIGPGDGLYSVTEINNHITVKP
jgi:hypothetical protein